MPPSEKAAQDDTQTSYQFEADATQILSIVIHSLYKRREIFLRELISNAADALQRIRFKQVSGQEELRDPDLPMEIRVAFDEDAKTITVKDTGDGMTHDELIVNLGTIASSGTRAFLEELKKEGKADLEDSLIGTFGVGFYSTFMVAEKVQVRTLSAQPEAQACEWISTGEGDYSIAPSGKTDRGTEIILHLREDSHDFARQYRLREVIRRYSNYVPFPIYLGEEKEPVNEQKALWRRSKDDIKEEDYEGFFHSIGGWGTKPLKTVHWSVDSPLQFYAVLFVPEAFDRRLFLPETDWGIKLFSKNVLIDDQSKDVVPEYLRFIKGVVDSEDLPLNVSREVVQAERKLIKIQRAVTSRILKEFEKMAKEDVEAYLKLYEDYAPFLKEGVIKDSRNRDKLLDLLRFHSTTQENMTSLAEYVERMKPEQEVVRYLLGEDLDALSKSPHLEAYEGKEEVLLLDQPIDAFLMMNVMDYKEKQFQNVDQASMSAEEEKKEEEEEEPSEGPKIAEGPRDAEFSKLIEQVKEVLGNKIAGVRTTDGLTTSPCRLVNPGTGFSSSMQRAFKYMGDKPAFQPPKILEFNPNHSIIENLNKRLETVSEDPVIELAIRQLFDNSQILEGDFPKPAELVARTQQLLEMALKEK
ncbi:MAG: molecular chaperone HtpG [Candidatus Hodarchaeota archaeon]